MRLVPNHPIVEAESLYQEYHIAARRRRWWTALPVNLWLLISAMWTGVFAILQLGESIGLFRILYWAESAAVFGFIVWVLVPAFIMLPTVVVLHFSLMLRTLLWAGNSIPREKINGTWELMLLSGISARNLVVSKWWATVQRAFPSYVRLAALRVGLFLWIMEAERFRFDFYSSLTFEVFDAHRPHTLFWLVTSAGVLALLTLLSLPFTAAIGIFTAFITRRAGGNAALAAVVRTLFLVMPGVVTLLYMLFVPYRYAEYQSFGYYVDYVVQATRFTLADNGALLSYALTSLDYRSDGITPDAIALGLATLIVIGYYVLGTLLALSLARVLAFKQGALEHPKRTKHR